MTILNSPTLDAIDWSLAADGDLVVARDPHVRDSWPVYRIDGVPVVAWSTIRVHCRLVQALGVAVPTGFAPPQLLEFPIEHWQVWREFNPNQQTERQTS